MSDDCGYGLMLERFEDRFEVLFDVGVFPLDSFFRLLDSFFGLLNALEFFENRIALGAIGLVMAVPRAVSFHESAFIS